MLTEWQRNALQTILGYEIAESIVRESKRRLDDLESGGGSLLASWRSSPSVSFLPKPPNDWSCEYCGSLHPGTAYICTRCGAPRRAKRPKPAPLVSPAQAAVWAVPVEREPWPEKAWNWLVGLVSGIFQGINDILRAMLYGRVGE